MSDAELAFDRSQALERLGDDLELLIELAEIFLGEQVEMSTLLREAVLSGAAEEIGRAAHKLKGAMANFSADAAVAAALRLEKMGRSGDLDASDEALKDLESEVERLVDALQQLTREGA